MTKEAAEEQLLGARAGERGVEIRGEGVEVVGDVVGQVPVLGVSPNVFHRIKLGSIGR